MEQVAAFTLAAVADRDSVVEQLNRFLRGEIAAVETYNMAIDKIQSYALEQRLERCMLSHEERVSKLRRRISESGGVAAEGSGAWGAFAKLYEGSAALFGELAAIWALADGEEHGLKEYREARALDLATQNFLNAELIPPQLQTHEAMFRLKRAFS